MLRAADFRDEEDAAAGTSVLTAWPPPAHAQDSFLKRSLDAERRRLRAAERAAHVARLIAAEQARSRDSALAQRRREAGESAAVQSAPTQPAGPPAAPAQAPGAAPPQASAEGARSVDTHRPLGAAVSSDAPELARSSGPLNAAAAQVLAARGRRVSPVPVTRLRTLTELKVRLWGGGGSKQ